jgi:hypothetical protein
MQERDDHNVFSVCESPMTTANWPEECLRIAPATFTPPFLAPAEGDL